jgi:hypothetical protein
MISNKISKFISYQVSDQELQEKNHEVQDQQIDRIVAPISWEGNFGLVEEPTLPFDLNSLARILTYQL